VQSKSSGIIIYLIKLRPTTRAKRGQLSFDSRRLR